MSGVPKATIALAAACGALVSAASDGAPIWTLEAPAPGTLPPRNDHGMAFDSGRARVVIFGGTEQNSGAPLSDTWEYDGLMFRPGPPAPPALGGRHQHAMAYDTVRHAVVLFGGWGAAPFMNDTWLYDGAAWTPGPAAAFGLTPRRNAVMAFDTARGESVLFGGFDGLLESDTWLLDAAGWRPGPVAPLSLTPRYNHAITYDPDRARVVLFGGWDGVFRADTWDWDGVAWSAGPAAPPALAPRGWHALGYDADRHVMVLFGGRDDTNRFDDTWDLGAGTWTAGPPPGSGPSQRVSHTMEYVPAMGGVMLFGGYHNFQSYSDTWVYQCLGVGPAALPAGRVGLAYAASLTATGGSAPCSFTLTVGSLPPGLTLAADGTISGTPASAGSFAFRVLAADATGCLGSVIATIAIDEAIESFVAAEGAGPANANRIRAYDAAGRPTPVDFFAYAAGTYGVRVATGHVVAAGTEEILTGPGPGPVHGPHVRAFGDDGSPIARVSFFAFGTLRYGVGVASCALDATAQMEMLAGAGPGAVFGPHVRAFTFDGSVVAPLPGASFYAYGTLRFGANVGAGDVDGAPPAEILTGPGPGPTFGAHVRAFAYAGSITPLSRIDFFAIPGSGHGCGVAGGDVDADGFDELCASAGPGAPVAARTVGFEDDGSGVRALPGFDATPFPSAYGARSSLGDVSVVIDDGRSDLVCGAGPDPAASSLVLVFRYDGAALVAVPGSFAPFPDPYGVDATSGALGL